MLCVFLINDQGRPYGGLKRTWEGLEIPAEPGSKNEVAVCRRFCPVFQNFHREFSVFILFILGIHYAVMPLSIELGSQWIKLIQKSCLRRQQFEMGTKHVQTYGMI